VDGAEDQWFAWLPLLILIVAFGFYPNVIFDLTDPAVDKSLIIEGSQNMGTAEDFRGCLDLAKSEALQCFDTLRGAAESASGN